jgi:hypothetical protein
MLGPRPEISRHSGFTIRLIVVGRANFLGQDKKTEGCKVDYFTSQMTNSITVVSQRFSEERELKLL